MLVGVERLGCDGGEEGDVGVADGGAREDGLASGWGDGGECFRRHVEWYRSNGRLGMRFTK